LSRGRQALAPHLTEAEPAGNGQEVSCDA
jgi:hypothetical protein